MRKNTTLSILLLIFLFLCLFWFATTNTAILSYITNSYEAVSDNLAATFFKESITISEIKDKYSNAPVSPEKVQVLIVPGHEPDYGGAQFGSLKERDMTVTLGDDLLAFLKNDVHYDVTITRDKKSWNPIFSDYFKNDWSDIITFAQNQKSDMHSLLSVGAVKPVLSTPHVNAPTDVALRLYGINKWANENNVDIEIHIHFNDYPRSNQSAPGKYSGFVIYVPDSQYSNSTTTRAIADSIFKRLSKTNAVSDLGTEKAGVVPDQDLIAIGSNNNANAASLLIEYGYIYEKRFQDPATLDAVLKNLAYQTYLGLQDFVAQKSGQNLFWNFLFPQNV